MKITRTKTIHYVSNNRRVIVVNAKRSIVQL